MSSVKSKYSIFIIVVVVVVVVVVVDVKLQTVNMKNTNPGNDILNILRNPQVVYQRPKTCLS